MSKITPRPEQVAELTRNLTAPLPLPSLNRIYLKLIAKMLAKAWSEILSRHQANIQVEDEPYITTLMESCLNNLRDTDSQWNNFTSGVHRGKELSSYDGSHLEKRSDLPIFLNLRNSNFPFIVECKLIDKSKPVRLYCDEGVARFIEGDYAWYDKQAFMLAYVRNNATIASLLTPHFSKHQKKEYDKFFTEQLPQAIQIANIDISHSKHKRTFCYVHQVPRIPGIIEIWHLWMSI